MLKLSTEQSKVASGILARMDKLAGHIQARAQEWGIPFEEAKRVVNALDRVVDETEVFFYGPQSLQRRQAEVLKGAGVLKDGKVFQRDADEPYMSSFESDMSVVQQDADEPYMAAYQDDQSSAVRSGQDAVGKPLTPHS